MKNDKVISSRCCGHTDFDGNQSDHIIRDSFVLRPIEQSYNFYIICGTMFMQNNAILKEIILRKEIHK